VYSLFARFGIVLPRDAADQRRAGSTVALANLRPGDLLFFAGSGGQGTVEHVAIYAGAGLMIDAPHTGAAIELVAIRAAPIWADFAGAVRIMGVH
jgi:cell wall-associated NlpC family hydrolase